MLFTLIALGAGLVIAVATGGRFRHLSGRTFGWWLLLPVAFAAQFGVEAKGVPAPFALLIASYVLLFVFGVRNLRHRGMWMVVLGFAMNFVVIATNHGMPVRQSAINAIKFRGEVHEVKRHREKPSDKLMFLADIIPVPPLDTVLSFGDMVLAVGVMNLLFNVMRPVPGRYGSDPVSTERAAAEAAEPEDETLKASDDDPFGIDRLLPQGWR